MVCPFRFYLRASRRLLKMNVSNGASVAKFGILWMVCLCYCMYYRRQPDARVQLFIITSRRSFSCTNAPLDRFILTSGRLITCPKLSVRDLAAWTTGVSSPIYLWYSRSDLTVHPAIGDAIDGDSSGYLSVTEVDRFFQKKPKEWSSSEWIA
jgi:hypothetical protein